MVNEAKVVAGQLCIDTGAGICAIDGKCQSVTIAKTVAQIDAIARKAPGPAQNKAQLSKHITTLFVVEG